MELENQVRKELSDVLEVDCTTVSGNDNLMDLFRLDSLAALEVYSMIEDKFNVAVLPEQISELKTINGIVNVIAGGENTK